jgi:hypothetical protein
MKITRTIFGQKGEIGIIVVLTLSIIGTLGLLVVKGPDAVNKYNNSLNRIRNENPTNEDMQYVAENLASLTDAAGGLPIPTGADDVLVAALQALTSVSTEIGSKPLPQPGHPGQVSPCGITVDPILAAYGEHVTAAITIPIAFQSGIKSITAEAGAEGFNVPPTGGTFTFGIPCSAAEHIQVRFVAYDSENAKVCSGSATVNIKPPLSTALISPTLSTTLISPTGTITTSQPTYKWNAECVATLYYLLVDDSTGRGKIFTPYSASEAGCPLGTGICSVTPSVSLADGNATWWVEPCSSGGCGAWSNALGFIVNTQDPIVGLWAPWDGGQLKIEKRTTGSYDYVGKVTVQNAFWIERDMKIGDEVWWLDKQTDGHYKGSQLWKGNFYWTGPLEVWITGNTMKDSTGKVVATKVQ